MAVSYKKLFHLLIEKNMTNAQLQQEAGFSANIITRLKRILEFVPEDNGGKENG